MRNSYVSRKSRKPYAYLTNTRNTHSERRRCVNGINIRLPEKPKSQLTRISKNTVSQARKEEFTKQAEDGV